MASVGTISANSFAHGKTKKLKLINYAYSEGSVVFSIPAAQKGVIEVIVIKKVNLVTNKIFGNTYAMYVDTYNSLWNEGDLCSEDEAVTISTEYLLRQQALMQNKLETMG